MRLAQLTAPITFLLAPSSAQFRTLDAICRRAMEDCAESRYSGAESLAADVEAWLADQPVTVMPESRFQKARRWLKKRPLFAGVFLGSAPQLQCSLWP